MAVRNEIVAIINRVCKEADVPLLEMSGTFLCDYLQVSQKERKSYRNSLSKLKKRIREKESTKEPVKSGSLHLDHVLSAESILQEIDDVAKVREAMGILEEKNSAITDEQLRSSLGIGEKRWRIIREREEFQTFQFKPKTGRLHWTYEAFAKDCRNKIDLLD